MPTNFILPVIQYRTVKWNIVWMVYRIIGVKEGVFCDIFDVRHSRAVFATASKSPDAESDWAPVYNQVCRIFRCEERLIMTWNILKLRQVSNTFASKMRRDIYFSEIVPNVVIWVRSTRSTRPVLSKHIFSISLTIIKRDPTRILTVRSCF